MEAELHKELVGLTVELHQRLANHGTEDVAIRFGAYALGQANNPEHDDILTSPARQTAFALSLLMATPEPADPVRLDQERWLKIVELLNEIFTCYTRMYFRDSGQVTGPGDTRRASLAVMSAFLHYHNTGLVATMLQVAERVHRYLTPHDVALVHDIGVDATTCLRICDHLTDKAQAAFDEYQRQRLAEKEKRLRLDLLDRAESEEWTEEGLREEAQASGYKDIALAMFDALRDAYRVCRADLVRNFGEAGAVFWRLFSVERGSVPTFQYLTDELVFDRRPLLVIAPGVATFYTPNALYWAVYNVLESAMLNSSGKEAYERARDKRLEVEATENISRLLPGVICYRNVFEAPKAQCEHDLIAVLERTMFVVEMKATPPDEPFRDPNKAITRLVRAFRNDCGPQKAYEQCRTVWRKWRSGQAIELFDKHSTRIAYIEPGDIDEVFMVCVTRDDYGPITCDLSLLLEKDADEPYPWVIDVFALDALADCWRYFGWGLPELKKFLRARLKLHGKVGGSDELEFAGFDIRHGLEYLAADSFDYFQLDPSYSNVFMDIWMTKHYGRPAVMVERTPPDLVDMSKTIETYLQQHAVKSKPQRQSPNAPCHCGSGEKYKRYHGRRPT